MMADWIDTCELYIFFPCKRKHLSAEKGYMHDIWGK